MTDTATNRYLTGPFAPVETELTAFDLAVVGTLPPELDGRYLRNGPNPMNETDPANYHWFLGDGMVHGVRLRDGKAEWYRNRWVRSTHVSEALGEAPVPGERFGGMDNANTSVIGHAGRTYAIVEAGARPVELSDELDTIRHSDLDGTLPHGFTAHPMKDPDTGELHAVNYHWARPDVLEYVVVGADGRVVHRVDVPVPGSPMVHTCTITEHFVVLYDLPVTFNLESAMAGGRFPYAWDESYGARVGLLPKGGEAHEVQWFEIEPCYVYHSLNAWEEGDTVVIDLARHPRTFATDLHGPDEGPPSLWRWTLDRSGGQVKEEQLDDHPVEFPRVADVVLGKRHRFGWGTGLAVDHKGSVFASNRLVRYDARSGGREVLDLGPDCAAGEVVFVPRSSTSAEDDGWYLTLVQDQRTETGELLVIEASAMADGPVARVQLPGRIPLGFHGNWLA